MAYHGIVKNGVVVLRDGAQLPEGTEVRIEPVAAKESVAAAGSTLAEQLADVIGAVAELPSDMADQHDHYLHGAPKR